MKKQFLSSWLVIFFFTCAGAQTSFVHFDKSYYFSGEHILYSLSLEDVTLEACMVQVSLESSVDIIQEHFHLSERGQVHGYIKIPFDVPSGVFIYKARLFRPSGIAVEIINTPVSIFNDQVPADSIYAWQKPAEQQVKNGVGRISIGKGSVHPGDVVPVDVEIGNANSEEFISVCVREQPGGQELSANVRTLTLPEVDNRYLQIIPVAGIRKVEGRARYNDNFFFGVSNQALQFAKCIVPEDAFVMGLAPFYGEAFVQFFDFLSRPTQVSIIEQVSSPVGDFTYGVDPDLEKRRQQYQQRKLINGLFDHLEVMEDAPAERVELFSLAPDFSIDVQDLALTGIFADVFRETVTPLKYRKKRDGFEVKMLYEKDNIRNYYRTDPIFRVNDYYTQDYNYLGELPLGDVRTVHIYNKRETLTQLNLIGSGGLVIVEMMDRQFALPDEVKLPGLSMSGIQEPMVTPVRPLQNNDIPSMNPRLFWDPAAIVNNGTYSFEFTAGDQTGDFVIEIIRVENGICEQTHLPFEITPTLNN